MDAKEGKIIVHKGGQDLHFAGRVWVVNPEVIDIKSVIPLTNSVHRIHVEQALAWLHMSPTLVIRDGILNAEEFTNYYLIAMALHNGELAEKAKFLFNTDDEHSSNAQIRWITHFYILEGTGNVNSIKSRKRNPTTMSAFKLFAKQDKYYIPTDKLSKEAMQILLELPA